MFSGNRYMFLLCALLNFHLYVSTLGQTLHSLGCFSDRFDINMTYDKTEEPNMSNFRCFDFCCTSEPSTMFIRTQNHACFCDMHTDNSSFDKAYNCEIPCPGFRYHKCGGNLSVSIHRIECSVNAVQGTAYPTMPAAAEPNKNTGNVVQNTIYFTETNNTTGHAVQGTTHRTTQAATTYNNGIHDDQGTTYPTAQTATTINNGRQDGQSTTYPTTQAATTYNTGRYDNQVTTYPPTQAAQTYNNNNNNGQDPILLTTQALESSSNTGNSIQDNRYLFTQAVGTNDNTENGVQGTTFPTTQAAETPYSAVNSNTVETLPSDEEKDSFTPTSLEHQSITSVQQDFVTLIPTLCHCNCLFSKQLSPSELKIRLQVLKSETAVDKTKTSLYRNKKQSANDNRQSSQCIGIVGTIVILIPVVLAIIIDFTNAIQCCKKNIK